MKNIPLKQPPSNMRNSKMTRRRSLKLQPGALLKNRRNTAKRRDLLKMKNMLDISEKRYRQNIEEKNAQVEMEKNKQLAVLKLAEAKRKMEEEARQKKLKEEGHQLDTNDVCLRLVEKLVKLAPE